MEFKVDGEFIKLDSLLKAANVVSSGGEAKIMIIEEKVLVNGEVEIRRGRKIYPGYEVICKFADNLKILVH